MDHQTIENMKQTTLIKKINCKSKYQSQINAINNIFNVDIEGTEDYFYFLENNINAIEFNLDYLKTKFISYLNFYNNYNIFLKNELVKDNYAGYLLKNCVMLFKPVIRFFKSYHNKNLNKLLNLNNYFNLQKNEKEKIKLEKRKEISNIINGNCLFITITMEGGALETILKYKNCFKNFYNNFRKIAKKYGFDTKYFIKSTELTKKRRLHLHLLFLNANINVSKLINFKKDLERILEYAGFGVINDVILISKKYTYNIKTKSDLHKIYNNKNYENTKIIKKDKLKYKEKKINVYLLKSKYKGNGNSTKKIINYVLKYILKKNNYFDDENINKEDYINYNIYYWLTGIRKYEVSRKMGSILKELEKIKEKRFIFLNDETERGALNIEELEEFKLDYDYNYYNFLIEEGHNPKNLNFKNILFNKAIKLLGRLYGD